MSFRQPGILLKRLSFLSAIGRNSGFGSMIWVTRRDPPEAARQSGVCNFFAAAQDKDGGDLHRPGEAGAKDA